MYHQNDETETENVSNVCSESATSSNASSTEFIPNAPSPVNYNAYGYKHSSIRTYIYHVISILLFGIPYLIFHSNLRLSVWFKLQKCDLGNCEFVLGE